MDPSYFHGFGELIDCRRLFERFLLEKLATGTNQDPGTGGPGVYMRRTWACHEYYEVLPTCFDVHLVVPKVGILRKGIEVIRLEITGPEKCQDVIGFRGKATCTQGLTLFSESHHYILIGRAQKPQA